MFFSISQLETLIVDLDSVYGRLEFVTDLVASAMPDWRIQYVTLDPVPRWRELGIGDENVCLPLDAIDAIDLRRLLRKSVEGCGGWFSNSVLVSRREDMIWAAQDLMMGTVMISGGDQLATKIKDSVPDCIAADAQELIGCLKGDCGGWTAEHIASKWFANSGMKLDSASGLKCFEVVAGGENAVVVHAGGRYFGSNDRRSRFHPLSKLILEWKLGGDGHLSTVCEIFARMLKQVCAEAPDVILGVPPRPGSPDRMSWVLDRVEKMVGSMYRQWTGVHWSPDLLWCNRWYPSLKNLGTRDRFQAVSGSFRACSSVAGKRIVLIDDVLATGATVTECVRTLKAAGAAEVRAVAMAFHPRRRHVDTGLTADGSRYGHPVGA